MREMVSRAKRFLQSYGVKCEDESIEEWLSSNNCVVKGETNHFDEKALHDFNEWCRWKGTAYEEGIDDQTRIERLLEEVRDLKTEIEDLKREKEGLERQLGITFL